MIDEELLPLRFACLEKIVEHPADIGKTKIQKITYFLQEAVGVPLVEVPIQDALLWPLLICSR